MNTKRILAALLIAGAACAQTNQRSNQLIITGAVPLPDLDFDAEPKHYPIVIFIRGYTTTNYNPGYQTRGDWVFSTSSVSLSLARWVEGTNVESSFTILTNYVFGVLDKDWKPVEMFEQSKFLTNYPAK